MSDSNRKSRLNKDVVGDNQTIFDFLKRKKQINLQNTVNKSLRQNQNTKQKYEIDAEDYLPQTRDLTKHHTHDMSNKYARTAKPLSITPQKIQFQDDQRESHSVKHSYNSLSRPIVANSAEQNNRRGKSFLSMISPIKNRAALQEHNQQKENFNKNQNKSGIKGNKSDNYVRRKLTKSIDKVKETISQLSTNIDTIKEKSHNLAVLFNPLFNYLSQGNHPVSRQVGQLRNKLRSFENLIESCSIQNCDAELQNFHRTLEQHLQTLQSEIRKQAQKSKYQELQQIKSEKQALIQKLQSQLKKSLKDNDFLIRKIQKIENSKGQMQQAVNQRDMNYVQQFERMKNSYEANIQQLQSKNEDLLAKLKSSSQQIKILEKQHKNEKMLKQSLEYKFRQELQQITEAKDAYLLNQIMVLKAQFNVDLSRVNQLHKIKEAELLSRIERREDQISQNNFENGCNKQIETKILEQANLIKQQNLRLKTQADCIVTDMYRMNQQLYQHWIALKDIKILSTRLGSFAQYRQVYQDLPFNDHLFQ